MYRRHLFLSILTCFCLLCARPANANKKYFYEAWTHISTAINYDPTLKKQNKHAERSLSLAIGRLNLCMQTTYAFNFSAHLDYINNSTPKGSYAYTKEIAIILKEVLSHNILKNDPCKKRGPQHLEALYKILCHGIRVSLHQVRKEVLFNDKFTAIIRNQLIKACPNKRDAILYQYNTRNKPSLIPGIQTTYELTFLDILEYCATQESFTISHGETPEEATDPAYRFILNLGLAFLKASGYRQKDSIVQIEIDCVEVQNHLKKAQDLYNDPKNSNPMNRLFQTGMLNQYIHHAKQNFPELEKTPQLVFSKRCTFEDYVRLHAQRINKTLQAQYTDF